MMTDLEISSTIYQQLGGSRFAAMTGAKNFAYGRSRLQFDLPRDSQPHKVPSKRVARVSIELNSMDMYVVTYYRRTRKVHAPFEALRSALLYADQLQEHFKQTTGLDTSL